MVVTVDSQADADAVLDRLSANPAKEQCGWLVDRCGMSWQVVPQVLMDLLREGSAARRRRFFEAVMSKRSIDIATVQRAVLAV